MLVLQLAPAPELNADGVRYLSAAHSLARGDGFATLGGPVLHQAPGYSVALAPLTVFGGAMPAAVVGLHFACGLLTLWLAHRWFARHADPASAAVLAALCVVPAGYLRQSGQFFSEPIFLPLVLGAALLLDRPAGARRLGVAGLALLAAATLTRTAGAAWAVGHALANAPLRHRWPRAAAALVVAGGVAGAWAVREGRAADAATVEVKRTQIEVLRDDVLGAEAGHAGLLLDGVARQAAAVGRLAVPGLLQSYRSGRPALDPHLLLHVPLIAGLIYGGWRGWRRGAGGTFVAGAAVSLGLHAVLWPFDQDVRYAVPLLPAIWWAAWHALPGRERYRRWGLEWLLLLHVAGSAAFVGPERLERWRPDPLPAAAAWAAAIVGDGRAVAEIGVDDDLQHHLALALDRPVRSLGRSRRQGDPDPPWLVGTGPMPAGYAPAGRRGKLWVARHAPQSGR